MIRAAQYYAMAGAAGLALLASMGPQPGWPRNDTLRQALPKNTQPPRRDKGTHYVFDRMGTRRVASA